MNNEKNNDIMAFHPGYYISEIIEDMGIKQEEFAIRLGTTPKTISKLVNEEIRVSNDLALKLSQLLNSSPETWLDLQKTYDAKMLEIKALEQLEEQVELIKQIDYSYFTKLGLLPDAREPIEKIKNLCSFLSIARLGILLEKDYNISYRKGIKEDNAKTILNANVWVETVTRNAREKETKHFNLQKFNTAVSEIAELTRRPFNEVIDNIKEKLADCGVVLVLMPYLKCSGLHGFVKWLDRGKVIIAISDRRKTTDTFWFTFFHEARHVQQKNIKQISFTWQDSDISVTEDEKDADSFAQLTLIPQTRYEDFLEKINRKFSIASIEQFAKDINRHPGIIVGRLQNDGLLPFNSKMNSLKTAIEF